jgi:molybdate transport system substrate-binding protein
VIKCVLFALLFMLAASSANADIRGLPSITVLAESSLTAPMTEIVRTYSSKNNITVAASYNSDSEQAWKIEQGESADVFIAAHPFWIGELKQKGLIDVYSISNLVKNKLVFITSVTNHLNERAPNKGLAEELKYFNDRSIMAIGDPATTAIGRYTKQALMELDKKNGTKLWDNFDSKTIKASNAEYNLYLIAHGENAGMAFYSQAYNNNEVKILDTVAENLHDPIIYQSAVVAGENMANARAFVTFLQSDTAKKVFKKYGFGVD